jgi:hypothetical protein
MSRRMNWAAASDRNRIRQHGAETVTGRAIGGNLKLTAKMSKALARAQELELAVNIGDDEKSEAHR